MFTYIFYTFFSYQDQCIKFRNCANGRRSIITSFNLHIAMVLQKISRYFSTTYHMVSSISVCIYIYPLVFHKIYLCIYIFVFIFFEGDSCITTYNLKRMSQQLS